MKTIIENIASVAHVRTFKEVIFNAVLTAFSFLFGYYQSIVLDNINLFMAVATVVVVDWVAGTLIAIFIQKDWQTKKALKIVYYLFSYWVILAMILSVEKGYPGAFWLSEAIIMPILVFQTISIVKNISILGLIPQGLLLEILNKIDGYKNKQTEQINQSLNETPQ